MKKQSLFYIFKFESDRIKTYKYNIDLTLKQARKNGELVSVGRNQVISTIFALNCKTFDEKYLADLFYTRKHLRRQKEKCEELIAVENEIDDLLFVPEIVSVTMSKKNDYDLLIKNGFSINGEEFTRLLCGSGHARRNTVIFCQKKIEVQLKENLNNGRKIEEMVLAKNNAYLALSYSGTIPVSQPYFCVVPDYELKRKELVDVIHDDRSITTEEKEIDFNIFDGQGLISPRLAKLWAEEMDFDHIPSCFIIRNSFLKGMVCTFDFHRYAEEVSQKKFITDVWGNQVNIRDMDLILTASQFKAWSQYSSQQEYDKNCRINGFTFGVSRAAPKNDDVFVFSNYQFLQVLNLNDDQIESLSSKTVTFFENVTKNEKAFTLLYLLGRLTAQSYDDDVYNKVSDFVSKALILNPGMIDDPYVRNHIIRSINKKIKESYIGNLIFDGNYSFIVQDPYALAQYVLGDEPTGLLERGQYFSGFWNDRGVSKIAAMRAPLTWRSEVDVLDLENTTKLNDWYQHLQVGCTIINSHGYDVLTLSDSDFDGDLFMTTNQAEFIDGAFGGPPVTYEKKKAKKQIVDENELWKIDKLSFDSRIGYVTNCSTTLYSMLDCHQEGSLESIEIVNRLKTCRRLQGDQIDMTKGIEIVPFPEHWVKWAKVDENTSQEEVDFNNSVIIDKRPYFMRYLYQDYSRKYDKFVSNYNNFCITKFGKSLETLYNSANRTPEEEEVIQKYYRFSPLLDSPCVMNKICHLMEKRVKPLTNFPYSNIDEETVSLLKNHDVEIDPEKVKLVFDLYTKYKKGKQNLVSFKDDRGESRFKTIEQYSSFIRQEAYQISTDITELATLGVVICYEARRSDSKSFVWDVFGEGLLENIRRNSEDVKKEVPFLDPNGEIEYLGNRYTLKEVQIKDDDYIL